MAKLLIYGMPYCRTTPCLPLGDSAMSQSFGYILSALIGVSLIAGLIIITHRLTKTAIVKTRCVKLSLSQVGFYKMSGFNK